MGVAPSHGFEVVADAFIDAGVEHIFSLLGQANLYPIIAAADRGAQVHRARHEFGAVAMATGFAHVTGSTGFATVSKGPSFVNALTAITSAARDRIPLVVYVGATPVDDPWNKQHIDQAAMVAPTGARFVACNDPASLAASVAAAFEIAGAERRPVVLSLPYDIVEAPAVEQTGACAQRPLTMASAPATPDEGVVAAIAEAMMKAERPVVLGGRGAIRSGARESLEKLAEATGALLATTFPASGLFHGNDFAIGLSGGYAARGRQAILREADFVVAFGASLNTHTMKGGELFANATIAHCDEDPDAIGRHFEVDLALHADAASGANAILAALDSHDRVSVGFRTPEIEQRLRDSARAQDIPGVGGGDGIDPRVFMRALDDALPHERRMTLDIGYFGNFVGQILTVEFPGQLFPVQGFVTLGLGLPTAIGTSVADPEVTTVAFVGDGGLLMGLSELETAGRLAPNLLIVVLNDRAYGAEVQNIRKYEVEVDPALVQYEPTPFARLAETLGIRAMTLKDESGLDQLEAFLAMDGPRLIDVHIDPSVN